MKKRNSNQCDITVVYSFHLMKFIVNNTLIVVDLTILGESELFVLLSDLVFYVLCGDFIRAVLFETKM